MKRILINDKKLPLLETLSLIIESQESKSISQAKRLFMEKMNCDEEKADDFVRNVLRNDLPSLRTKDGGKFILGATRMYLDGELQDGETILRLNKIIRFISSSDKINEFDRNLNGLTLNKLSSSLNDDMENSINAKKSELDSNTYTRNSNYDIIRINSFEEASEYSKYTSWCITKEYLASLITKTKNSTSCHTTARTYTLRCGRRKSETATTLGSGKYSSEMIKERTRLIARMGANWCLNTQCQYCGMQIVEKALE